MPRRNFGPDGYEHQHIRFTATVEVDLHNVGADFALSDAVSWLEDAIERGLKLSDPNDKATAIKGSAKLKGRPACGCYKESVR